MLERLRTWLFGNIPAHGGQARRLGTALIHQIAHGGLRTLKEEELMQMVDYLLTTPQLRYPLRGNTRFLESVAAQYHRKHELSPKQLQAVYNILERAYPHNLAAELKRFSV
jgi:hypothetical protein